jgi:hypothetical protein
MILYPTLAGLWGRTTLFYCSPTESVCSLAGGAKDGPGFA